MPLWSGNIFEPLAFSILKQTVMLKSRLPVFERTVKMTRDVSSWQGVLSNHLIQIGTGEGKSIALGFTAAILATLGFSVDVVCYSR